MKHLLINILAIIITAVINISAASGQTDSLNKYMELTAASDDPAEIYQLGSKALQYAEALHDTAAMIEAYNQMAWAQCYVDPAKCINLYTQQYKLASETNNHHQMGKALYNLAGAYSITMRYHDAIKLYKSALKVFSQMGDNEKIARVYRDMATNCVNMELYASAYEYINLAKSIDQGSMDSTALAHDYCAMLQIYMTELKKKTEYTSLPSPQNPLLKKAIQTSDSIIAILPKNAPTVEEILVMSNYNRYQVELALLLADIYGADEKGAKYMADAVEASKKFEEYATELMDEEALAQQRLQLAKIKFKCGQPDEAIRITDSLKSTINDSVWPTIAIEVYKNSSTFYDKIGKHEQALRDFQEYDKKRALFMNDTDIKQNAEFRTDVLKEEQINELIEKQDHETSIRDERIKRQTIIIILAVIMLIIVAVAVIVIVRALNENRSKNILLKEKNAQLYQQQEEILAQRNIINEQKNAAERSNYITTQSINYARHIQRAAMPSMESIKKLFPDSFIYYQPKDIVSGDFYYVGQNGNMDIFVLADCTGHGVPGGFLSMLGMSALKEILRNHEIELTPGIMLDMMREYVKQSLSNEEEIYSANTDDKEEEEYATADGMDMSIVAFDMNNHFLRYAGAYQSLYVARNGEIIRLKGDRMPVGRHINEGETFSTQFFNTRPGDMIYLASDGIPSQIGYSGVKFMTKRMIEFFKNNCDLPCAEQHANISKLMDEWLDGSIQIDDLSLVGIRIS